jgi:hypothetical protein
MYNYLYLIQDKNDIGTNIYKIGKTTQLPDKRFKGYVEGSYPLCIFKVDDCDQRENDLKKIFREKYTLERGYEYFKGNINNMIQDFVYLCGQVNQIPLNKDSINQQPINNITNNNIFFCELCNREFSKKHHLENHLNKLNKCNISTNHKCDTCNRYFKTKQTLIEHKNKSCTKNEILLNNNTLNYNNILNLIKLNISNDSKVDIFMNNYNKTKLSKNTIKEIINNNELDLKNKVQILIDRK